MILYGAGGHGKVVRDICLSNNKQVLMYFDDNSDLYEFEGIKVSKYSSELLPSEELIISIGDNKIRKQVTTFIKHSFGIAIHHSALLGSGVFIDFGTVVMQGAIIQAYARIGKHVIVNTGASVDHDCKIDDFVHISPRATLCGNVIVGEGTKVGAASVVIPGVKIGKWCTIGAGAVIIRDVPDYAVVVGNPGKVIKFNNQNKLNE